MLSRQNLLGSVILAALLTAGVSSSGAAFESGGQSSPPPFSLSLLPATANDPVSTVIRPLHIDSPEGVVGGDRPVRPVELSEAPDETVAPRAPLMGLLDQARLATYLDSARINLYGHIEGSFSILTSEGKPQFFTGKQDFDDVDREPDYGINDRLFDYRQDNHVLLNRIDFNIERTAQISPHEWDFGFRTELMYGSDARYIHANGWEYASPEPPHETLSYGQIPRSPFDGPEEQWDLTQAYIDIGVPLGNGTRVRVGKFLYFLNLDPNQSIFYSHSIWWTAALPYTLTGAAVDYAFSKDLDAEIGISRGWNQSLLDNNSVPDYFLRVTKDFSKQTSVTLAAITGAEFRKSSTLDSTIPHHPAVSTTNSPDRSHFLTAMELNVTQTVTDRLSLYLDGVFGHKARTPTLGTGALNFTVVDDGQTASSNWYGLTAQGQYELDPHIYLGGRLEWYRDEEGFTLGQDQVPPPHNRGDSFFFGSCTYYEATVGLTILPLPNDPVGSNLKIRPEVRFDWASKPIFNPDNFSLTTFAVDAIFNF